MTILSTTRSVLSTIIEHLDDHKVLHQLNNSLNVFAVDAQTAWDPIAANNDGAFTAARAACAAAGGGTVLLPRLLKISAVHDFSVGANAAIPMNLQGLGSGQGVGASTILCTSAGAGLRFGDVAGGSVGGISSGFHIDADNLATIPFRVGIAVGRTFTNVDVTDSADVGVLLEGTQNCTFNEVNTQGAANDGYRLDRCNTNTFLKCEVGSSGRYQLHLMSGGAALPGTVDYPSNNAFYNCLFEYHEAGTLAQVFQSAGVDNMMSDCAIATSGTVVAGLRLVKVTKPGTPFSFGLRLRDCTLQYNFSAATVAVEVGDGAGAILSGTTGLVGMGTAFQNANTGVIEVGRSTQAGVTTYKSSTGTGLALIRTMPDINDSIACSAVSGVDKALPIYVAGVFVGYVAVGQTLV